MNIKVSRITNKIKREKKIKPAQQSADFLTGGNFMLIEKTYLTVSETAHVLNCSSQKVYQLIKNGDLEGVLIEKLYRE